MKLPHVVAVDLAGDGIVVRYEDGSTAFYHESVLQQHLINPAVPRAVRRSRLKPVQSARQPARGLRQSAA